MKIHKKNSKYKMFLNNRIGFRNNVQLFQDIYQRKKRKYNPPLQRRFLAAFLPYNLSSLLHFSPLSNAPHLKWSSLAHRGEDLRGVKPGIWRAGNQQSYGSCKRWTEQNGESPGEISVVSAVILLRKYVVFPSLVSIESGRHRHPAQDGKEMTLCISRALSAVREARQQAK